jgi:oxygen-independent coproporphyrinogen-3 oxidase
VGELPIIERNKLTKQAVIEETVFLGLRMIQGLDLEVFARRFGQTVEEVFPGQIKRLLHFNLLEKNNGFLQLTRRGLLLANQVFAEFV